MNLPSACCDSSGGDGVNVSPLWAPSQPQTEEDLLLVKELNQLSVQERDNLYEEIHGVAKVQDETPEYRAEALKLLWGKLKGLPRRKKHAFNRALFLKPSLEQDEDFLMMFLRADRFDAEKAALRLTRYFDCKLDLFGESKLVKKITMDDLSPDDMESVNSGCFLSIPDYRDQVGRPIQVFFVKNIRYKEHENLVSTRA